MNNLNIVEMEVIMKNKFEFKIKNNFYYRYPYFSYDFYSVELIKKIETIISDVKNNYMENILVSSQRLYKAISNKYNSKNLETSIYKYLLRSSVRSTPYGINAGVGLGNFNVENNFILIKDNKKRARVDVEWLVHVIKICEKKLGYDLYVTHTNCYYTSSNRLKKYYDSCYVRDEKSGDYGSSIRNTNLVKAILNLTNNYIKIYDLLDELTIKFGEENRNKIYNIIMDLLESEFLTSNLKINLLSNNPYKKLLSILDRYNFSDEIFSKLKEIDELIEKYNNLRIGTGEVEYLIIIEKMKEVYDVENYLQVDMYNESKITLNEEIKKEIEEFANFLISRCINETYNNYIDRFREFYGEQAVRVIDVLDPEKGLGFPTIDGENTQKYMEWWLTILLNYVVNNDRDYVDFAGIKDEFPFKYNYEELKYPLSFELSLYLVNENGATKYIISPMLGSEAKWKSFGRFDYLFDESLIQNDLLNKKNGFKDVEITFYPTKSHEANVSICKFNKSSYMELNTSEQISGKEKINLSDVYMYIDKNSRISFVQGSTNEILNFSTTNKYITDAFPKILKMLVEVEKKQKLCFESFFYALFKVIGNLSGHIPEIRYKNFIISQECWKLDNRKIFKNNRVIQFDDFKNLISQMITKEELPVEICTGPIDRKLILNLTKEIDIKILYKMIKTSPNLSINKNQFNLNNLLVMDKKNQKYICEFVFQFEQNSVNNDKLKYSSERIPLIDNKFIDSNKYYPFNKWITLNLYINEEIMDILLANQVRYLSLKLLGKKYITSFFYIRYKDPKNHLRIRFKINNDYNSYGEIINEINSLIQLLKERSLLNDVKYESYLPEINRYGGIDNYLLVEKLFYMNSLIVINLIDMLEKKMFSLSKEQIFLIGSYKIVQDMKIGDVELIEYIKRYKLNKKFRKIYLETQKEIEIFFEKSNINDAFLDKPEYINLQIELEKGTKIYREYWLSIIENYSKNNFDDFIVKRYCLNSILHMFFNRLIGIDRDTENVMMGILEKAVHNKVQKVQMYEKN